MSLGLRLIALFQGFGGLLFVFATPLALREGLPRSAGRALALLALLVAGPLGLWSAVQLTRLRESGRRAALAFVAVTVVFSFANGDVTTLASTGALKLGVNLVIILILTSVRARRLCSGEPDLPRHDAPSGEDS